MVYTRYSIGFIQTVKEQYTEPAHYTVYDPMPIERMKKISVEFSLTEKRWIIANKTGRTEVSPHTVFVKVTSNHFFPDI